MQWIPAVTYRRRLHRANLSKNALYMRESELLAAHKIWSDPELSAQYPLQRARTFANTFLCAAGREFASGEVELAQSDLDEALRLDPHLNDGVVPRALSELEAMSEALDWPERLQYMQRVFSFLPARARPWIRQRRQSLSRVAISTAFLAHAWHEAHVAGAALRWGLYYNPRWIRNRGVVSLLMQTLLGYGAYHRLKSFVKQIPLRGRWSRGLPS
jgi:hypothetical protein